MQDIKNVSYSGHSLQYKITIGSVDVSNLYDLMDMDPVSYSLDYPVLAETRVGDVSITFKDPDGDFAPAKEDNFFVKNGLNQSGHRVALKIEAGYQDVYETLFDGQILEVIQDSNLAVTTIEATNKLHNLFTKRIFDLGVDKHFGLELQQRDDDIHGTYPIPEYFTPVADKSDTVNKSTGTSINRVPSLAESGHLDPDNYIITSEGVETEGGPVTGAAEGYPQIEMKAPLRYKDIEILIKELLSIADIADYNIDIPIKQVSNHFSSNGRIGYDFIANAPFGSSKQVDWQGYPTDWIYENGFYYILFNPRRDDKVNVATLVSFEKSSNTYSVLYRAPFNNNFTTEFWKIAKNGNNIAILATDASTQAVQGRGALPEISVPVSGSYDSTESGNRSYIFVYDISDSSTDLLVGKSSNIKAHIGHYYIFGQTYGDYRSDDEAAVSVPQQPPSTLPDTRHSFQWHNNSLYFVYTDSSNVGVARVSIGNAPASVIAHPLDGQNNQSGFDFSIDGDTLFAVGTFKRGTSSSDHGYKRSL